MKILIYSLLLALPLCGQNITRFAGIYNALDYAYGVPGSSPGGLKVSVGNVATGAQTITLDFGYTTLSDGTKIYPISTNAPITVGSERVTPSSITCLSPNVYSTCQIRATFSQLHGPGDNVASGTHGLQEAINAAATLGGAIVVDGKWTTAGGTQGMIDAATVPANTAINDNRQGQVFGNGSGGSGTVTSITAGSPLTGGTITHSGTIGCQAASGSQAGCLSAADYTAFTGKQPAGSYITALSGDGTASGPGSVALTLATVNGNVGACGDATHTSQITLDAKGRATSCTPVAISGASSAFNAITSGTNTTATMHVGTGATLDATGSGSIAATTMPGAGLTGANSVPASTLPLATTGAFGVVKPDGSTITVSAGVISSVGGSGFQSAGLLSARPATCTVGTGIYQYFATDQPIGQQWYFCSATNTWTQFFLNDSTLTNTAGTFGVDLNQFCRFTNSCTVAARWDFSGAASTSPNKKGLASAIPATCTVGDTYFETDATAGQNLYGCTATNTWTLQGGSGSVTTHYGLITNTATTQTIPGTSTATPITFDTNTDLTNSAIHSTSSNQQNFVADATGRWSGACQVTATNNAINFSIVVFINSTAVFNNGGDHTAGAQNVPWSYPLTSGDIVTCQAVSAAGFTVASVGTTFYGYLVH